MKYSFVYPLVFMICLSPAYADFDQLQQQRQAEREKRLIPNPQVKLERPPLADNSPIPENETPCFPLKKISLDGEDLFRFTTLLQVIDKPDQPLGKCVGSQGINIIMARMQNEIIARGYVTTRVLASPQDFSQGELKLTLVPGEVNALVDSNKGGEATLWNAIPSSKGRLLNLRDIEQGLENFKRVPTVEADIQITPSAQQDPKIGLSDLVVKWQQKFPWRFSATVDDSGTKSTGKLQGSATLSYDNPLRLNDLFFVTLSHDLYDRVDYGTSGNNWHYSLPYGYALLSFNGGSNHYYQTIQGLNKNYVYSGDSNNLSASLATVFYRNSQRKLTANIIGWNRQSRNYIDDTQVDVQHRRVSGWELVLSDKESIGKGNLEINFHWKRGTGAFDALPSPEEGASGLRILSVDTRFMHPIGQVFNRDMRFENTVNVVPTVQMIKSALFFYQKLKK